MENLERIRERLSYLLSAPLLPVAMAYMGGVVWHAFFPAWWWAFVAIAVSGVAGRRLYGLLLGIAAAAGIFISTARIPVTPAYISDGNSRTLSGVVTDHHEYTTGQMMVVRIDSCRGAAVRPFLVKTYVPRIYPPCYETYRVKFSGKFTELKDITDLPEQTDHNTPLKRRGVSAEAVVSPDSIQSVTPEPGMLNSLRRRVNVVQRLIGAAPLSDGCKNFLLATLTGDRSWLGQDTLQLYSTTGLAHVLALSGMHVAIITTLLTLMLLPLNLMRRGRHVATCLCIVALWLFAILTGLSVSVVRAVTMATMLGVCTLMQRVWNPLNALAAAALGITIIWPWEVFSLGFILTFTAVLCIIIVTPALSVTDGRSRVKNAMWQWVAVPVAAMAGTGIVSLYYFHTLPVCFLLTNVVSALLLPGIIGGGLVLIMLNAAGLTCGWLGRCVDFLYHILENWAERIASMPLAHIDNLYMPGWMIAVYFVVLAALTAWLYTRRRVWLIVMLLIALATPAWFVMLRPVYPSTEIFLTRSNANTNIYIKDGDRLLWYTNASEAEHRSIMTRAETLYKPYLLSRGLKGIVPLTDGMATGRVSRRGDTISAAGYTMTVLNRDVKEKHTRHVDYAVMCRGVIKPVETAMNIGADTILLSDDLHGTRLKRYERELTEAGIPVIAVHERPFNICR